MTKRKPSSGHPDFDPAKQTGEEHGRIKQPQQTDATMAETDRPRGSEPRAHARRG
ncbi:MAG: hypothetical protein JF593_00910 [Novosphingobium sp.]|nr:hypothetical protein [Novosphingobium sp.]